MRHQLHRGGHGDSEHLVVVTDPCVALYILGILLVAYERSVLPVSGTHSDLIYQFKYQRGS